MDEAVSKGPASFHSKLHTIFKLMLMLFEVRRGGENMGKLKKKDFAVLEDPVKNLK